MFFSKLALLLFASAEVPFALSMAHADKMIDAHDDARLLGRTSGTDSCSGYYACYFAGGDGGNAIIGDGSCIERESCVRAGQNRNANVTIGIGSCIGQQACAYAGNSNGANFGYANIGDGSCIGYVACGQSGAGGDGSATIGPNSCNARDACSFAGRSGGRTTIGRNSCNADHACETNGYEPGNVGSIGDNSCNGLHACTAANAQFNLTVGSGSCNGREVCKCLENGDIVPDNRCNTFGEDECCITAGRKGVLSSVEITSPPTAPPTSSPTAPPTSSPTASPTSSPTASPTSNPTASPTSNPTASPTPNPTVSIFSWEIDPSGNWTATFDDQSAGNELGGQYEMTVGRYYTFEVLKPNCISAIANNTVINYVEPESKIVPLTGLVDAKIDIVMDQLSTITDTEVFSADANTNTDKIEICIKGSLQVSDTDTTVVNFHETKLTIFIDKTRTFVVDVDTERTAATDKSQNVTLDYNVTTFICAGGDLNNSSTWVEANSTYSQGAPLKVCLRLPSTNGVDLDKVSKFELDQVNGGSAGTSLMISDNSDAMAGGILANSRCTGNLCMIQSMIPAKYFDDTVGGIPYNLIAGGNIVLKFGDNGDERRLKGVLVDSSSIGRSGAISRGLQSEESAVSSSFEVSVGLKGENMVEDDGREVSAANPSFAGRLPVLLSFVGAVLFTGVALVN